MSSAKGKRLELVRRCIEEDKKGLLNKHHSDGVERIVSEFYTSARQTTKRSRPWGLGKALARLRGHSSELHGMVERIEVITKEAIQRPMVEI